MRRRDVYSRIDLGAAIRAAFTEEHQKPKVVHLDRVANFRDWIKPVYHPNPFLQISTYYQFGGRWGVGRVW